MNHNTNRPRRLLIVTYHFPPSSASGVFRMLGFAQHLPRCGWQVGVVAPPRLPDEPVDAALSRRVPPDTAVFSAPYPHSRVARIARLCMHDGVWMPWALPAVVRAVREFQPDAVLTSGPPHCVHFLGLFLKRFYQLPWVASFRDPWFTGSIPDKGWASWDRFWERRVFKAADCVIANTPLGCREMRAAHPSLAHKIAFVTNGFDPESFPTPAPLKLLNERLTILHAGDLYGGRDPRPFFDVMRALADEQADKQSPIRLRLLGQATEGRQDFQAAIRERGLENSVECCGQVPYAQALAAMTSADILLLLDSPGRKIGIPGKLFEYLGAGRPVLALGESDGDTAWALKTSGAPHRFARDPASIRQALEELRAGLQERRFSPPSPDQLAAFSRAKLAQDLAGHLDRIALNKHMAHEETAATSFNKESGTVVRSTQWAAAATVPDPLLNDAATATQAQTENHASERLQAAPAPHLPHYAGA